MIRNPFLRGFNPDPSGPGNSEPAGRDDFDDGILPTSITLLTARWISQAEVSWELSNLGNAMIFFIYSALALVAFVLLAR